MAGGRRALWDRAYKTLKEREEPLVVEYEAVLQKQEPNCSNYGNATYWTHEDLSEIIKKGLEQQLVDKTEYTVFGHKYSFKNQSQVTVEFIQRIKTLIDDAVKVSPEASLAWAGVCVVLPILTNHFDAKKDNSTGFVYVTSRMSVYVQLWDVLQTKDFGGLRETLEDQLITIYWHIIRFLLATVVRVFQSTLKRLARDIYNASFWKDSLSEIKQLEETFDRDFRNLDGGFFVSKIKELKAASDDEIKEIISAPIVDSSVTQNHSGSGDNYNINGDYNRAEHGGAILHGAEFKGQVTFGSK
ncbi:hypothetical protein EsH8_XI_000125 [Colletotrichum jinshuiense]